MNTVFFILIIEPLILLVFMRFSLTKVDYAKFADTSGFENSVKKIEEFHG
jgi:hypothetical protein